MVGAKLNNRYTIISLLGEGAMGEVYLASHAQTGQRVAVKVLARQLITRPELIERFRREAETLRQLDHPNIVKFVDTFAHEGQYVIVMEYVPGGSLHELISKGPLPIEHAIQITLDLCDALIRAHRLNVIHRDLKPENILINKDGTPKLADFGVARLSEGTRMTRSGTQVGTPYYMSPEAWEGKPLDAQADIWSLGVVLFEMLTGQVPFGGDTPLAVMTKVSTTPPPELRKLRADVPSGLVKIISKMLTRNKQRRYQTMREVAVDLERQQQAVVPSVKKTRVDVYKQIAARIAALRQSSNTIPSSSKSVLTKLVSRLKVAVGKMPINFQIVGIIGSALLVIVTAVFLSLQSRLNPPGNPQGIVSPPALVETPSLIPTQTEVLPTRTLTPTSTLTSTSTPTAIGGGEGKIAFVSDRDGKGEIYVMNLDENNPIKLTNNTRLNGNLAISPDRRKIAFGSFTEVDSELHMMDPDGSNPTVLTNTPGIYYGVPIWSPDSKKIVFDYYYVYGCCLRRNTIHLMNADGSNETNLTEIPNESFRPAWSPDGEKIAFSVRINGNNEIYSMKSDGSDLINLTNHEANDDGPAWSPDGQKIAFLSDRDGKNEIYIMDSDGSSPVNLTNNTAEDINPIWSPDGQKIAFISQRDGNDEIYVMNADGTNPLNVTNHRETDSNPVWSPDGTKVAFVSERDQNLEIYIIDANGRNLFNFTNNDANDYFPVWFP